MRVAVIAYHSNPLHEPGAGDAGGMTVYVRSLAAELARSGVATDVFTRATSDAPRVAHLAPGVRFVAIEAGPRASLPKEQQRLFLGDFVSAVRAFAATQHIAYDVIHSHYWQGGVAAASLARSWRIPLVHSHHTLGLVKNRFLAPGDAPEPTYRLEGEAEVIDAADVLVASTDEERHQLAMLYDADQGRLKTIHPGVEHRRFHPDDRDAARSELELGDEIVLLSVGRIQRLKGLDLAIETVAELAPALDRPVKLVIAGGPSGAAGEAEMERLGARSRTLGVDDRVVFAGAQPHDRLPVFYRAADAVLVCSYSESFGLVALEAQACGAPVVGTAVGGLSHVVRDGVSGYLIDERDASVFAGRLKQLLADAEQRESFTSAAVRSAARFSWPRTAGEMLELYECLVQERSPEACTC